MRIRTKLIFILFITIIVLSVSGCYYDKEQFLYPPNPTVSCSAIDIKFSTAVNPIIQSKCATAGCHDANSAAGGTVLETYAQISAKAARIKQRCVVDKTMPPNAPLTTSEIATLKCWIGANMPNN